MSHNNFAEQLKTLRKNANLTQQLFADKLNVHLQTVSKWERGISEPDISLLGDIACVLGVSVGQLLIGNNETAVTGNFSAATLGANISKLRHAAGEDQKTLAKALCVSADTVSKWERAKNCPDIDSLVALAKHFAVPLSALYCGKAIPVQKATVHKKSFRKVWIPILVAVVVCALTLGLSLGLTSSDGGGVVSGGNNGGDTVSDGNESHVCTYGDWQVTQQPTCTQAGEKVRVCSQCNTQQTDVVAAIGHSYTTATIEATCTQQGYVLHTCNACGNSYKDTYTDVTAHQLVLQTEQPATCTKAGAKIFVCSVCKTVQTVPINATGHSYSHTQVPSTCTQQGYTLYTCDTCGNSYKDNYLSLIAHVAETLSAVPPTCTDAGLSEGERCGVCKNVLVQQEIVPATGHVFVEGSCSKCDFTIVPTDDEYFTFNLRADGTYEILSARSDVPQELVIPWSHNGIPVTTVCSNAIPTNALVKSIFIPQSIVCIESGAFMSNTSLNSVYYLGSVSQWLNVDIADYNFMHAHALYFNGTLLTDLTIPEGIATVKRNHFHYCSSLKTITFTEDVVEIQYYAFEYCINAESIYIPYTVLTVGAYAFSCTEAVIYCEANFAPDNWDSSWCYNSPNIKWGYCPQ